MPGARGRSTSQDVAGSGGSPARPETMVAQVAPEHAQDSRAMFTVENTEFCAESIECRGCTVSPTKGQVLFVCAVRFTEHSRTLSLNDFCNLQISDKAKGWARTEDRKQFFIDFGDFRLRLKDQTMIPCAVLPADEEHGGPPLRWSGPNGDGWLMYAGFVRVIASVNPDAEPISLVWGGTYKVAVSPPPDTIPTDKQLVLRQDTLMKFLAGATDQDVSGYSSHGAVPKQLQEVIKKELAPRSKIAVGLPKVIAAAKEHAKDGLSIDIHWFAANRSVVVRDLGQPHSTDEGVWALSTPKLPVIFYRYRLTESLSLGFAFLKGTNDKDPRVVFVQLRVSRGPEIVASAPVQPVEMPVELKESATVAVRLMSRSA